MISLNEQKSVETILKEFSGITNEEAYVNIFAKRMMKPVPGSDSEFLGCNHRIDMLPFLQKLIGALPENGHVFDVGAGSGDVVDFALKKAPYGTTVHIEEPNLILLETYLEKIRNYPNLHRGTAYGGVLQDYYQNEKPAVIKNPQNLILAMHMIYHLTEFSCPTIQPEQDLIEAFSFLFSLLAPGGSIFIAYADLLDGVEGSAVCGLAEKYFRKFYPNEPYADNLMAIYRARNRILGENGLIKICLSKRFPSEKISFTSTRRMCHFFGESKADIGVLALATELCSSDQHPFDLSKLNFCLDFISKYPEKIGLQKEERNVPQKGLWKANEPHVIAIIKKEI